MLQEGKEKRKMIKIILVRHGQSEWNAKNRFTGWVDARLSDKGKLEAKLAGALIKNLNIKDLIHYTSYLRRAKNTLEIILNQINCKKKLINESWELNERHYGSFTGLNKTETKIKLGESVLKNYRRSWDMAPPPIDKNSLYLKKFSKLNTTIPAKQIPLTESLKDTYNRVVPFYKNIIQPQINFGKNILIVAHGNSLRALCKYLFSISNKKINKLEIPTGNPLCVKFNNSYSKVIRTFYLDDKRKEKIYYNE